MKADTALNAIPTPADRDTWLKLTTAYKAAGGSFEVWDIWSAKGEGYNQRANKSVWDSITPAGGITEATLYREALANGWTDTDNVYIHTQQRKPSPRKPAQTITPAQAQSIGEYIAAAARNSARALDYCIGRGLTAETVKRFNIGYDLASNRLIIPYPAAAYYVSRSTNIPPNGEKGAEPKYKYPPKASAGDKPLFNLPALNSGAPFICITEGQIDAITLEQCGLSAIASTEPDTIINAIERNGTTTRDFLIIPDNDPAGQGKAQTMQTALSAIGRNICIYTLPEQYHDVNNMQTQAPAEFTKWAQGAAVFLADIHRAALEQYSKITGAHRLEQFNQDIHNRPAAIPTGYPTLDLKLGDGFLYPGGLYPGLYIIGGISSIGKTTFFMQMADQIAASGTDCLVFSLEMSAGELIAKSISRLTAQNAAQESEKKTTRGILQGNRYSKYSPAERAAIAAAQEQYRQFAKHLYIIEGAGNIGAEQIREQAARHYAITGRAPVVFVDYLQILSPVDMKATDKQNTDRAVLELKRISRDYNTAVIAISSFNRENYTAEVSLSSFKESGAIEYSSDVLIGLQLKGAGTKDFNADQEKQKDPREIELKILKNRNGATGAVIPFEYHPKYNLYHDVKQGHEYTPEETGITNSGNLTRYTAR